MVLFRPTYLIEGDVTDIDLDLLHQAGIKGLIFDLDSTLMAPRAGIITTEVDTWLIKARDRFQVAVLSNNKRPVYIEQIKGVLNMPVIGHAAKPSRKGFVELLSVFNLAPHEVAVIGDRPLTDIWGGQRAGMKTILVFPLKTMNEPGWITFFRNLERLFIRS